MPRRPRPRLRRPTVLEIEAALLGSLILLGLVQGARSAVGAITDWF